MKRYLLVLFIALSTLSYGQDIFKVTPTNVTVTVPLIAPTALESGQVVNLGLLTGLLNNYMLKKDAIDISILDYYMPKTETVDISTILTTKANYVPLMNSSGVLVNSVLSQTGTKLNTPSVFYISSLQTAPTYSTSTGAFGEVRITNKGIYICVATNSWIRCTGSKW